MCSAQNAMAGIGVLYGSSCTYCVDVDYYKLSVM